MITPSNGLERMLNYEVSPPEQAWANITQKLEQDDKESAEEALKLKMLAYEEIPPIAVFNRTFNQLDADDDLQAPLYITKLKLYEENAPADTWRNIAAQLDEEKIVPLTKNRKNIKQLYIRISVAAAIIALFLLFIWPAKQNTNNTSGIAKQSQAIAPAEVHTEHSILDSPKNLAAKTASEPIKINIDLQSKKSNGAGKYANGNYTDALAQDPSLFNNEKLQNAKGTTPMDITLITTPNTYISVTGADGQTVKVSSKFSNLLSYLIPESSGTKENIDVIIEESAKWKKTFAEWKDKMTNNGIAPDFSNFMDIIELSKVVENK